MKDEDPCFLKGNVMRRKNSLDHHFMTKIVGQIPKNYPL